MDKKKREVFIGKDYPWIDKVIKKDHSEIKNKELNNDE